MHSGIGIGEVEGGGLSGDVDVAFVVDSYGAASLDVAATEVGREVKRGHGGVLACSAWGRGRIVLVLQKRRSPRRRRYREK